MNKESESEILSYVAQDKPWPRDFVLSILKTALSVSEYRFAREVALSWLIAYPGDLSVSQFHAEILIQDKQTQQALPLLETLCAKDPEYLKAQELLFKVQSNLGMDESTTTLGNLYALSEKGPDNTVPKWSRLLRQSRHALSGSVSVQSIENAENIVQEALAYDPPTPLMAVTHLRLLNLNPNTPLETLRTLAKHYQQQWSDCLTIQLILADILMRTGKSEKAVAIIHRVASQDVAGKIAARLWGKEHKYQTLWPDNLDLYLNIPIPAEVAGVLGLNLLAPGALQSKDLFWEHQEGEEVQQSTQYEWKNLGEEESKSEQPEGYENLESDPYIPETLRSVHSELERVARRLKRPGLVRSDGRFPIYVVFTTRSGLEKKFGQEATRDIHEAMRNLVASVRIRRDWGAILLYADDPTSTAAFGIKSGRANDPWGLKLVLADLDGALGKQGAMIGSVLIVGGPEVVPFHNLPNPTDDVDDYVPSDNPYATRDENYFIPEWSIGRLTCGVKSDPTLLINMIDAISSNHESKGMETKNWLQLWWKTLLGWLQPSSWRMRQSFGYSAEAWRRASWNVFNPIGEARDLITSPPEGVQRGTYLPFTRLGYFNLHGLANVGAWYGQRDPLESPDGPDYPIAIRPEDIYKNGQAPRIVFSEACYGANILNREVDQAMALKFLASGSQVVVGSTVMSYGSVNTPLIAADLLGKSFWEYMREGYAAGEAFRRAKIHLAQEMHHRQGYLDGEDQKTLISFIYLGDPLADIGANGYKIHKMRRVIPIVKSGKRGMLRSPMPTTRISTICDRSETPGSSDPIPPEVMVHVKQVVAQYLPGLSGAQLSLHNEHAICHGNGHACPTAQFKEKHHPKGQQLRKIVVLSKELKSGDHIHQNVARLRLDKNGRVVKLAVSR